MIQNYSVIPVGYNPIMIFPDKESSEYRDCIDWQRIKDLAAGDSLALKSIVDCWKKPLFIFFNRSLNNFSDAEDLTQKTFFRVYRSASNVVPKAKFSTWIFKIARNLLIDEINKRKRRPSEVVIEDYHHFSTGETDTYGEIVESLSLELQKIPEKQKTALLLRVQQEWSYREIANFMNVSESNVKTLIHRARLSLRESLKN